MSITSVESYRKSSLLHYNIIGIIVGIGLGILLSLVVMGVSIGFIYVYRSQEEARYKSNIIESVSVSMANMRSELANAASVVETMSFMIRSHNCSITLQQFLDMTQGLRTRHGNTIQAYEYAYGPSMPLVLIDPITSPVHGLKLLEYNTRHAEQVLKAIHNNTITVFGPFKLIQGGVSINVLYPIWYPNGTIHGISSALISLDELFKYIVLPTNFQYIMYNPSGIFYNTDPGTLDYIQLTIDVYSEIWTINVYSGKNGWYSDPYIWLETISILVLMCLTIFITALISRSIAIGIYSKNSAIYYRNEFEIELKNRMKNLIQCNISNDELLPTNIITFYMLDGKISASKGDTFKYLLYHADELIGKPIQQILVNKRLIQDKNGNKRRCIYKLFDTRYIISIDDSDDSTSQSQ